MRALAACLIAASGFGLVASCEDPSLPCDDCPLAGGGQGGEAGAGGAPTSIACPASGVFHGPWSMRFTDTTAVVRWDACKPSDVAVTVTPERGGASQTATGTQTAATVTTHHEIFDVIPDLPGTYYTSEVAITGLTPGECYRYAVVADPAREGRFCTSKPSAAPFTFMAIGDTNPAIAPTEELLQHVLMRQPDFVVHLGDIQYYSSVLDSWSQWFISMQPMLSGGAFMPSIGNHESENETEYADYYDRLFAGAGFDGTRKYYRYQSGGFWFFSLDTEMDLSPNSEQGIWLAQMLEDAAQKPGFRGSIRSMHRPVITVGDAGSDPGLRSLLEPLFEEHGVRLVLAGHMHGYERFVSGAVTYITSGGGGGLIGDVNENVATRPEEAALRQAVSDQFHAVVVDVGASAIQGVAIDASGSEVDAFSISLP